VLIDVTEQVLARKKVEESEKQFRQMAELMPQKVWTSDAEGNKNYFNKRLLDYTGFTFEELKGPGWEKIIHPDDWEKNKTQWQESIDTGKDYEAENRLLRKDGKYLWHLTRATAIKDDNGKIKGWIASKTEIQGQQEQKQELEKAVQARTAELQQANKELEEKNNQFEKINKELESFSYVASHDLQEPLRKIQTFANRILDKEAENLSDKGKDYFKRMQSAAGRMQQLIQDLLSFSRINMAERNFESTDLNIIIEEVKTELKESMDEKHATIDATELCPANIIPFQFRQLMHNLLGNALKFSKAGIPPHIIIKSKIEKGNALTSEIKTLPGFSSEKDYCHITVTDNGIGFDPQYKDQVFEVFQRLHGREEYSGTGIGLAIVKKIVENHSGMITVTSEPDKGAQFDIYIPG
jgi:two-component system, chemotaxis family, CheB/CheR fusion protein